MRPATASLSGPDEGEQIRIDDVGMGGQQAVRIARIHLQRTVSQQLGLTQRDLGIPECLDINVSSVDMQNGDLGQLLEAAFKKEDVSLKHVVLEATEAVYMATEIGSSIASCSIADVITGDAGEPRRPIATNTKSSTGVWHRDPLDGFWQRLARPA